MADETVSQAEDVVGCDSVSGSWPAILRTTGIDIREHSQVMDGSGEAVVVKDGHKWTIKPWAGGGGFAVVTRPQTDAELERDRRHMLRRTTCSHFSKDRLLMCLSIADQLRQLAAEMNPDQPPSRATRRGLRRKLDRLAQIQIELLWNRSADSEIYEHEVRQIGRIESRSYGGHTLAEGAA